MSLRFDRMGLGVWVQELSTYIPLNLKPQTLSDVPFRVRIQAKKLGFCRSGISSGRNPIG